MDFYEAHVDGCAYGLQAPAGGLIKKPWRWRSTTKKIWQLQRLCQCQHPHTPCEGGELTRLSALYPPRLCAQVARLVKLIHLENEAQIYTVQNSPDYDVEVLKKHTDQELIKVATDLMSLHRKLGHPSKQAFTEPCIWRLRALNANTGRQETIGLVAAHVDDFLLLGDESNSKWIDFLEAFHKSMKWSPWEVAPFQHCGVQLSQKSNGNWILSQREFCEGLNQVEEDGQGKDLTSNEIRQCRAVLGSAQWRVYQTAPHHAAKLSHLQSLLPKGDRDTLKEINKFVRELYGQRDVTLEMHDLQAECDEDLVAVGWSDAALAN
eukprot:s7331_g1.t1